MYDALTPLFDQVTDDDLMTKFKSERFGVRPEDGPGRPEPVPRAGVTVVRDRFNVPHITGRSRDDVTWAMGWLLQQDRGLLLAQARDAAKLAAIDAPNVYAFGLVINLRQYTPTPSRGPDDRAQRPAGAARARARRGKAVLHDVDVYLQGINARLKAEGSAAKPWTRVDVFAANAIIGEIFGEGGGDEARRSEFLSAAAQAVRHRAREPHVRRLQRVRRPRRAGDDDAHVPLRDDEPGRARQRRARRRLVQADRPERARARGQGAALGEQLPARRRAPVGHRAPAVRRRPADRLHVPGPHARGRHQLARRAGARRDGAGLRGQHPDRPRAGLRVVAHERRAPTSSTPTSRRCAAGRAPSTATRAAAARWAASTRARSPASGGSSTARPCTGR